jgi:RimJ/RimL family protein N-acetyltransferase
MKEWLPGFIRYGFEELALHRIQADADPRNVASIRLLESLGFLNEGYLRECYRLNGEIQDAVILSLLKTDINDSI